MPKAYWVAHVEVFNPEPYAVYAKAATAVFAQHGARILARGGAIESLEGQGRARNVIIEFDSMEAALACYHSPEYQAAKAHREGHAKADLMMLEGVADLFPTTK